MVSHGLYRSCEWAVKGAAANLKTARRHNVGCTSVEVLLGLGAFHGAVLGGVCPQHDSNASRSLRVMCVWVVIAFVPGACV